LSRLYVCECNSTVTGLVFSIQCPDCQFICMSINQKSEQRKDAIRRKFRRKFRQRGLRGRFINETMKQRTSARSGPVSTSFLLLLLLPAAPPCASSSHNPTTTSSSTVPYSSSLQIDLALARFLLVQGSRCRV
jgi:hypothetical protein